MNRHLLVSVKRGPLLSLAEGTSPDATLQLGTSLVEQVSWVGQIGWIESGRVAWDELYRRVATDDPPGLLGSCFDAPTCMWVAVRSSFGA